MILALALTWLLWNGEAWQVPFILPKAFDERMIVSCFYGAYFNQKLMAREECERARQKIIRDRPRGHGHEYIIGECTNLNPSAVYIRCIPNERWGP